MKSEEQKGNAASTKKKGVRQRRGGNVMEKKENWQTDNFFGWTTFWMDNFLPSQFHVENWRDGERRAHGSEQSEAGTSTSNH